MRVPRLVEVVRVSRTKLIVIASSVCLLIALVGIPALSQQGLLGLDLGGLLGGAQVDPAAEQQLTSLINADRGLAGLPVLAFDSELAGVARQHAGKMAGEGQIFHNSLLDSLVSRVFKLLGENVGVGQSVESLHEAFLDSFTHRLNVVGPFNKVGIGVVKDGSSYYVTELFGRVGSVPALPTITGIAPDASGSGYWTATTAGGVYTYGNAARLGSEATGPLSRPVVGMASTPSGNGYWMVASDGGVFSFGDARFYGSTGDIPLASPIVGMASTPTGRGYWLVAGDGGIFSFGDARFWGSAGSIRLSRPVVGMASSPSGRGYWLVASDGGVFSFGDAGFYGSTGNLRVPKPVVAMAPTRSGGGYWLASSDGGVYTFGDAPFLGSAAGGLAGSVVGMARNPTGTGYWLATSDRTAHPFGNAPAAGGS